MGLQDVVTVAGTCVKEDCQDLGYLTAAVAKHLLDGGTLEADGEITIEGLGTYAIEGEKNIIPGTPEDYVAE